MHLQNESLSAFQRLRKESLPFFQRSHDEYFLIVRRGPFCIDKLPAALTGRAPIPKATYQVQLSICVGIMARRAKCHFRNSFPAPKVTLHFLKPRGTLIGLFLSRAAAVVAVFPPLQKWSDGLVNFCLRLFHFHPKARQKQARN